MMNGCSCVEAYGAIVPDESQTPMATKRQAPINQVTKVLLIEAPEDARGRRVGQMGAIDLHRPVSSNMRRYEPDPGGGEQPVGVGADRRAAGGVGEAAGGGSVGRSRVPPQWRADARAGAGGRGGGH